MRLGRTVFLLAALGHGSPAPAMPPPVIQKVPPDDQRGRVRSRWLAPYVEYTESWIGRERFHRVRWFSEHGELVAETDSLVAATRRFPDYFRSGPEMPFTFHGLYGDWQLPAPSAENYGVAASDGRTFIQFVREGEAAAGITVFSSGTLVAELGPFPDIKLATHSLGADGSVAAVFSPDSAPDRQRLIATDPAGHIFLDTDVSRTRRVHVAPDGRGVLIRREDERFAFVSPDGAVRELAVDESLELSDWFAVWIPGSLKVLLGSERRRLHALVDCARGETLWHAPAPEPLIQRTWVVPFGPYVFQSGLALGPKPSDNVRVIRVLDMTTGDPVAWWNSSPSAEYASWPDVGTLIVRDGRLYYVTDDEFSELHPDAVADPEACGCCPWTPVQEAER